MERLVLYSFGDTDRSGKVRWMAEEIGLPVEERRVAFREHVQPDYLALNPLGSIPTAVIDGEPMGESTAVCELLAELHPSAELAVLPGDPERRRYLWWRAAFAETCETRLVDTAVSRFGLVPEELGTLHTKLLKRRLRSLVELLPAEGFLCGRFTVADIVAGYNLRLAIQTGMIERGQTEPYLSRLIDRPAARRSRVFASLEG